MLRNVFSITPTIVHTIGNSEFLCETIRGGARDEKGASHSELLDERFLFTSKNAYKIISVYLASLRDRNYFLLLNVLFQRAF